LHLLLFGPIGMVELLVIAFVILLLFGSRLPGVMRNLGRGVSSFKEGLKEGKEEDERAQIGDSRSKGGRT